MQRGEAAPHPDTALETAADCVLQVIDAPRIQGSEPTHSHGVLSIDAMRFVQDAGQALRPRSGDVEPIGEALAAAG
jgi:hypothetical protein